ncbi:MAG: glycosyltransferase family 4 protein [Bacteroidota bacterium]
MAVTQVLHILWSTRMGGISTLVRNLCVAQLSAGESGACVYSAKFDLKGSEEFRQQFIPLTNGKFKRGSDLRPLGDSRLHKLIQEHDIIHFHAFHPMLFRIASRSGKKIVYTEHGNFGLGRTWDLGERISGWLKSRMVNRHASAITFNSTFTRDTYLRLYGTPRCEGHVIPNGISATPFIENKSSETFIIACAGRLAAVKRFDRVIDAFRIARLSDAKLIIMGDGPELHALREQAVQSGLGEHIEFRPAGNTSQLFSSADVCIVSSQGEAFGLVALEAYQQGKKVIAFEDGGGICELVKQEDANSLVKHVEGLASLLQHLQANRSMLNDTDAIRRRISLAESYSIQGMASQFQSVYTA